MLIIIAMALAAAPESGVRALEVSLDQSVSLMKGTSWPTSPKTGVRGSLHTIDGPSVLTVKFPSGKTWRAAGLHSVSFTLAEKGDTVRSAYVDFERPPSNWADTVERALQLATELGVPVAEQERWRKQLTENPGKGSNRYFPSFPVEGCISLTTTITPRGAYDPKRAVSSWTVSVELNVSPPEFWRTNHSKWPATCQ